MIFTKKSKRAVAIFTMLVFLLTLVPVAAMAGTSGSLSALSAPTAKEDTVQDLGTILVSTVAGAVYDGHTITLRLPSDYEWNASLFVSTNDTNTNGWIESGETGFSDLIGVPSKYSGTANGLYGANIGVKMLSDNEIQIKALSVKGSGVTIGLDTYTGQELLNGYDGYMYVYTKNVTIPDSESGDIKVVATSPISQGFPSGEVVVGKITGGEVLVTVDEVKTFTDESSEIILRLKETVANSFDDSTNSMKLRLPNGFKWNLDSTTVGAFDSISSDTYKFKSTAAGNMIWGNTYWFLRADTDADSDGMADKAGSGTKGLYFGIDGRDLYIKADVTSGAGTFFKLPVTISVDDETVAKYGDVKVIFSGDTDAVPSELVIAKYNEMGSTVSATDATTVIAGKTDQEIGDIVVEESAPQTLTVGRTITMTLPSNAKWYKLPSPESKNSLDVEEVGFVGTDGRTYKWKVNHLSGSDAGKLTFEDGSILLSGDASGKVEIELGGTAGVEGKVEVATIQAPVEASATSALEVKIGMYDQAAGDLIITELADENIDKADLEIALPDGVEWSDVPTITVEEGDISLDEASTNDSVLTIPVKATSTTPSKIKISDIKLDIDRTVPEGDVYAKVKGLAVNNVNDEDTLDDDMNYDSGYWYLGTSVDPKYKAFRAAAVDTGAFPNVSTVAKAAIAKIVTPAPVDQKKSAKFVIGDTTFSVNGIEYTMDVAPYVKDGRTYLPVRYVAQALGVADSNILWDNATQKVTLIKGGTVVQLTIGSNVLLVNGAAITMDVPAEITSDRTMLPFRFIAQAFGASVGWDEATQTVTMDLM